MNKQSVFIRIFGVETCGTSEEAPMKLGYPVLKINTRKLIRSWTVAMPNELQFGTESATLE